MLDTTSQSPEQLRDAMVDRILGRSTLLGGPRPPEVERALRTVPRHLFCEGASLEEAYTDTAIVTNRDENGRGLSSVSAPWLQSAQLGQARLKRGDRVLEIGSGGYNAALIQEVVGPEGSVTSVDIDPAVIERAQRCLSAAGYQHIEVILMDAEKPLPGRIFDAIIVTVGAWDISPAWVSQLAPGGRLVVPLRTMGVTRSWELLREGDALVSRSDVMCGFVSLRGQGAHSGQDVLLSENPQVSLYFGEAEQIDAERLAGVLDQPRHEVWTGVTVPPNTSFQTQDVWLSTTLDGFCLITADPQAIDEGLVDLPWPHGTPALVSGNTLAYRPKYHPEKGFGAVAQGPDPAESIRAAEALAAQIVAWDQAGRPSPVLTVHPASTPDHALSPGFLVDKRHTRLAISWSRTSTST